MTVVSRVKTKSLLILLFGGLGFCTLSIYLISKSLAPDYPQLPGLLIGFFLGAFGVYSLIASYRLNKYVLDKEKLIVKSIFNSTKRTIRLSEIKSFNEIEKKNKYSQWKDLTLFTDRSRLKITSSLITNYPKLASALTTGKKRDIYSEKLWHYKVSKRYGIGFIVFGVLLTTIPIRNYFKAPDVITTNQLKTLNVTIAKPLKINKHKSSRYINVMVTEYPNFIFEITGTRYKAARSKNLVNEISNGDIVKIDILIETYEKKLSKTKELSFLDKTVNYNQITVNGLRKSNKHYLTLEDINYENIRNSKSWGIWFFLLAGIGITIYGFYLITRKKPMANGQ